MLLAILTAVAGLAVAAVPERPPAPTLTPVATESEAASTERRGEVYYHLMRARLALSQGRAGDVIREVGAATALMPDEPALLGESAMLLAIVGRRGDAERTARRALTLDDGQKTAMRVLADLSLAKASGPSGNAEARDEAIRLYERLAREDERPPAEIFAALARLRAFSGDLAGATEAARRFQAARPSDPNAVRLLAQTLAEAGHADEALTLILDWIERAPDDVEMVPMAVELSRGSADWGRVESVMAKVVEAVPDSDMARALLGEALIRTGRPAEAIQHLERAREGPHAGRWVAFQLALAYGAAGRLADAEGLTRSLSAEFPDNPLVRSLLGDTLARRGDLEGAATAYDDALRAVGSGADGVEQRDELRRRIAAIALAREKPEIAIETLTGLERPDDPAALETRADALIAAKRLREARAVAGKLRKAGEAGVAAMIEGRAALAEGDLAGAMARLREAITTLGPAARGDAAALLAEAGHEAEAEEMVRGWVRAEPASAAAHLRLGAFLERARRWTEAEAALRESVRLDPRSAEALNYLGYLLIERTDRVEEGITFVRRALSLEPGNGAYLDSLGWGLYRLGRYAEARDPLEGAARELPRDPTILDHLGDLYARLGEGARALDAYRRAIEAGADDVEAIRSKMDALSSPAGTPR